MAKNDSKAQKAARNLEHAKKFKKKVTTGKGGARFGTPFRSATPAPAGGGVSAGGPSTGPRQMYPAVCSACGMATEVPFQPTEGRQVLCRPCFSKQQ